MSAAIWYVMLGLLCQLRADKAKSLLRHSRCSQGYVQYIRAPWEPYKSSHGHVFSQQLSKVLFVRATSRWCAKRLAKHRRSPAYLFRAICTSAKK